MSKINVLDSNTINKIAAGEVVERPASVVKELVENAVDAKATAVTVEIKDGGISFIRITDNGTGIDKEDISVAFYRHSTSKIKSVEDLLVVSSLGFRGEALSSIASVSQIELMTKTSGSLTGIRYKIEGGSEKSIEDIGCPQGTTFIVRNLFYNTPARRKFLKTAMTEAGYISDLMHRLALSHPEVSFKFINNGQTKLHTTGNMRLKDIIYNVYGRDITANLLEVSAGAGEIQVKGFIGKPLICRGNRAYENYFINGRYIRSGIITKAIEEAYKNFIMVHKYPLTVLHFTVDTSLIDVNVHPTKMEIRFNNSEEIYRLVYHAVRQALEGREIIPQVSVSSDKEVRAEKAVEIKAAEKKESAVSLPEPFEQKRREAVLYEAQKKPPVCEKTLNQPSSYKQRQIPAQPTPTEIYTPQPKERALHAEPIKAWLSESDRPKETPAPAETSCLREAAAAYKTETAAQKVQAPKSAVQKPEQLSFFETPLLSKEARPSHKLIGQIFDTYWIVEYDGKMFIIDQHAAHEKVLYEKIFARYKANKPLSQFSEPPIILSLSMKEETALKENMESFTALGFEIEPFGGSEYAVRAVPMDLYGFDAKDIVVEMIDQISSDIGRLNDDMIADRLATAACKAAVKGNHRLSAREADALIELLLQAKNPYTCPHGRPTIISMSKYELEKKFKRIQ